MPTDTDANEKKEGALTVLGYTDYSVYPHWHNNASDAVVLHYIETLLCVLEWDAALDRSGWDTWDEYRVCRVQQPVCSIEKYRSYRKTLRSYNGVFFNMLTIFKNTQHVKSPTGYSLSGFDMCFNSYSNGATSMELAAVSCAYISCMWALSAFRHYKVGAILLNEVRANRLCSSGIKDEQFFVDRYDPTMVRGVRCSVSVCSVAQVWLVPYELLCVKIAGDALCGVLLWVLDILSK